MDVQLLDLVCVGGLPPHVDEVQFALLELAREGKRVLDQLLDPYVLRMPTALARRLQHIAPSIAKQRTHFGAVIRVLPDDRLMRRQRLGELGFHADDDMFVAEKAIEVRRTSAVRDSLAAFDLERL